MAEIKTDDRALRNLKDKIVVITGSAQGIGARTVHQLFHAGARLVVGDLNDTKGRAVVGSLQQEASEQHRDVTYVHVDVSNYGSILSLFRHALELHGRVDIAIHCAAITEDVDWFAPGINMQSIEKPPSTKVLEVNLLGTFYFTQVALAALNQNRAPKGKDDKSISLISSVAGFKDSPGLFAYSASKHGVMGLMRSSRGYLPSTFNVRMNVICPWATDTEMLDGVRDLWVQNALPMNTPDEVARLVLQCAGDETLHGKAVYVADGKGFDIEEGINRLEPEWMGQKQASDLARGQEILGMGSSWSSKDRAE